MTLAPPGPPPGPSAREQQRRAVRRRLARNRRLVALVATVAVFGVLGALVLTSPGWARFQETFLAWEHAEATIPDILKAFGINISMFLAAEPLILLLGGLVAVVRNSTTPYLMPARIIAVVYTDLFRGLPTLLVVLLFGFGIPTLGLAGLPTDPRVLGTAALVLCYGAYVAEVIRAGIDSIHPSQIASAQALGLGQTQTLRHVVLPQALRRVAPPLLNDFVSLQKDTALISALGVFEALFVAQDYGNYNFNFTPYLVVGVVFVALTVPLARFTDWLGKRALQRERGR